MADLLADVRRLLPGATVTEVGVLGGSERSDVRRVRARWPDRELALVVKRFAGTGESWVRESAALSILPADAPAPRPVAESAQPAIVVMSDLGRAPSVADALLDSDAAAAGDAVRLWARTIGRLHRATLGERGRFRAALGLRSGDIPVADHAMSAETDESVQALEQWCLRLGIALPPHALSQLRELPRRLGPSGEAALSPSDACPDNNVRVDDGLVLIDFEGAQWRHVAWDVAYLMVPWPSCWCSWRMPGDVSERALEEYRATIADALPYVRTPQFRDDVVDAAAGWSVLSTTWFLPRALGDDPPSLHPDLPTPSRRAMILHRLDGARRNSRMPALATLAGALRERLVDRWGEVRLALAPAFEDA
jgi:Phosphotransferase enzyme family